MTARSTTQLDRLLEEVPFVRALAGALAADDADDVAQNVWLRAMRHDTLVVEPRRWLAQVLRRVTSNLRRGRARRTAHEHALAPGDAVPSSAELMEREERRRELVGAVDALPEHLRAVVVLRYFEELPPRRIAVRLGLPVGTVWNRLRSALQALRRRLDACHGDRRAFLLPLLPSRAGAVATGLLMLSVKARLFAGVAAVVVVLGLWTAGVLPIGAPGAPPAPGPAVPLHVDGDRAERSGPSGALPGSGRTEVAAAGAVATTGTLVLAAIHQEDDAPVPGLAITAVPAAAASRFARVRAMTDAQGLARLEGLAPGEWLVRTNRNLSAQAKATVLAGRERHATLVLPAGIRIDGIVVDAGGVPVPGAEVHLAPSASQRLDVRPVASTGADGRFALRSCSARCAVGARAAGHAPSRMLYVNLQDGGRIDLRLELPGPGGVVEGVVKGPDQSPIGNAAVVVGAGLADIVLTTNEGAPAPPAFVHTDAAGRFRAVGLAPGEHPVEAEAAGFGLWTGTCQVAANATAVLDVVLPPGVRCTGVVLDATGTPVANADVSAGNRGRLGFVAASSGADGSFRLDGLAAGEVEVRAMRDGSQAKARVRGRPGETVTCELRFDPVLELRGRVLRTDGEPIAGAFVTAPDVGRREGRLPPSARSDATGRFVLRVGPADQRLLVRAGATGHRPAVLVDVDPRAGEVELRLQPAPPPSVRIAGRVVGADGQPVAQAQVQVDEHGGSGTGLEPTSDGGVFALGPLVPGRYRVCVQVPGAPWSWSEWRDLAADAEWNLGDVRLPVPGTLAIRAEAAAGLSFRVVVADAALAYGNWGSAERQGDRFVTKPLAPGRHYVMAVGDGVDGRMVPADVRLGEVTPVDLVVQPGLRRRFELHCAIALGELHVRVQQGDRLVLAWSAVGQSPGTIRMTELRNLARGDYVVSARGDGHAGEARFTVRDGGDEVVRIELR